ncbi:MAG: IPT/TIG domain-containing protein, partial [Anaerolineae bacterium]
MRKSVLLAVILVTGVVAVVSLATSAAASPLPQLALTGVEPDTLASQTGGTLSIYGSGFTTTTIARLAGFGLLETTYVNSTALMAVVPPGVPAGTYDLQVSEEGDATTLPEALTIVAATPTPA